MKKIKSFCTRDDYIDNGQNIVSPVFELSDRSLTFSKDKHTYYYSTNPVYSLKVFNGDSLTTYEAESILSFIDYFTQFATNNSSMDIQQLNINSVSSFNILNPSKPVTNLSIVELYSDNSIRTTKYMYFIISDVEVLVWLSDTLFQLLYPDYIIDVINPVNDFSLIINDPNSFVTALDNFNIIEFNDRVEDAKNMYPSTITRIINIPYRIPTTNITKNCYFGFNIYGDQGNFIDILRLYLYEYLLNDLSIDQNTINNIFPSLLQINEFFITPRWDLIAIPTHVGQSAIHSQITNTFEETFELNKFITIYNDVYLQTNTYNFPTEYNNLLTCVTNGLYSDISVKDFKTYFNDIIAVTSTSPDFSRMSTKTQNFVTILTNLLTLADSSSFLELFNKLIGNNYTNDYKIRTRDNITYITIRYEDHVYYVLPKYEFIRLNN